MSPRGVPRPRLRSMGTYLHPREQVVTEIRHHWIVLARPILTLILVTALALWADANAPASSSGALPRLLVAIWLVTLAWVLWRIFEWRHTQFVVTDKRIMLFHGWITRKVSMMPLTKVTDMSYNLTVPGRILGYGHFVLESAGQDQAFSSITFVPNPDVHYQDIVGQIFGLEDADDARDPADSAVETEAEHAEALERAGRGPGRPGPGRRGEGRPDEVAYGPHVLTSNSPSIYRSRDRRPPIEDTGELPPYDPDWRP